MKTTPEPSAEVSFDALLAMAVTENARREQAALPGPARLQALYPDTSRWDARLQRRQAPHGRLPLRRLAQAALVMVFLFCGAMAVSAEVRGTVYSVVKRFLPIEVQVSYEVEGQPRTALPAGYTDHYRPEGFVLDEVNRIDNEWEIFHNYLNMEEEKFYSVFCIVIPESGFKSQYDNEHTVWTTMQLNGVSATLGINTSNISDNTIYYLLWEKDGIHHAVESNFDLNETIKIAEGIY